MPIEFRDGLWWPVGDRHCRPVVATQFHDVDLAISHVKGRKICVQAGGNCGIWPSYLAGQFDVVWTIEADLTNYLCLLRNVEGIDGVRPIWGALSDKTGRAAALARDRENVGAHYIDNGSSAQDVTTIAIDDLELDACDLMVLDIEGYEPLALRGAAKTIEKFKPVLMIEDKGLSMQYGTGAGWTAKFPGYQVAGTVHRDVILVPC